MTQILDDIAGIKKLDSQDQFGMVAGLPRQVLEAYELAAGLDIENVGEVGGVAVAGMGGSAIGGDVVATAYEDDLGSPINTVRGYHLPHWIGSRSLMFAVSYSGNTEETIACLGEALERGCRAVCVTTGGRMGEIARERRLPLIEVPAGLQPRAAMGWLSVPIAACLEGLGLLETVEDDVREAVSLLSQLAELYGPANHSQGNPAKQLAAELKDRVPVIYGAELTSVAALRWKCQINENAKSLAFCNRFPELNHNEIVGWQLPAAALADYRVIMLKDEQSHPQNLKRMRITAELLSNLAGGIREYPAPGRSRLARVLASCYLGDFASLYLAILYGLDPSPVKRIEDLKKRLV